MILQAKRVELPTLTVLYLHQPSGLYFLGGFLGIMPGFPNISLLEANRHIIGVHNENLRLPGDFEVLS